MRIDWTPDDIGDLTGRTFVVTGAGSGLGLVLTRDLLARGARAVIGVRDTARARAVYADVPGMAGGDVRPLDLLDLDSVRSFAAGITAEGPVDVLVNNAGISSQPRRVSPQGWESQLATNHLGHFTLTGLLLPTLARGSEPRVVTVSSGLYKSGRLDPDDLAAEEDYSAGRAYATSKLANALFGLELGRRLRATGSPVSSLIAHPGLARTPLHQTYPSTLLRLVTRGVALVIGRPPQRAALPLLFASTSADATQGSFIGPTGRGPRTRPEESAFAPPATDAQLARRLWEVSERDSDVHYPSRGGRAPVAAPG